MQLACEEAEIVMFNAVADLLDKTGECDLLRHFMLPQLTLEILCFAPRLSCTGLKPRQIDVLITNCSLFNPTPSLAGEGWYAFASALALVLICPLPAPPPEQP